MTRVNPLISFAIVFGSTTAALALPAGLRHRSLKRFLLALPVALLGIIVPLLVFLLSSLLTPDSKSASPHGWVDSFHVGKLALTPLVLWATASLYASDVLGIPRQPWIRAGLLVGALVSTACLAFGVVTLGGEPILLRFLALPAYVSAWFVLRAVQALRGGAGRREWHLAFLVSLPLWLASLAWSYTTWRALPEQPPECAVETRGPAVLARAASDRNASPLG